jgi:hypothetical protein
VDVPFDEALLGPVAATNGGLRVVDIVFRKSAGERTSAGAVLADMMKRDGLVGCRMEMCPNASTTWL